MWIKKLELTQFRNYEKLDLDFSKGIQLLHGSNGQGKTSILEAIALAAYLKSFRASNFRNIVRFGSQYYRISSVFGEKKKEKEVEQYFETGGGKPKKQYWVNKVTKKPSDVFGEVKIVVFSPEQLQLLLLGPEHRRKYLNFLLVQNMPRLWVDLVGYNEILKQRNMLLQRIREGSARRDELEYWDNELVEKGVKIINARIQIVSSLNKNFGEYLQLIANQKHEAEIVYRDGVGAWNSDNNVEQAMRLGLEKSYEYDMREAVTHKGPHRDNFELHVDKKDLMKFGSRGELRTAVLAMKFSEKDFLSQGSEPIFLFDDVFSELDDKRRDVVLDLIGKNQALITSAELSHMPKRSDVALYSIKNAKVKKK
ncbi:DNA replication/repair protein RecF [Patescibacteria group bacterium]